ncbi:hypothetical protein MMC29_006532 [Sticta canariensis]|nr:hypothetical protein [Sticta canariensis]
MDRPSTPPPDGDQNRSGGLFATTLLVTCLAIILVTLRMIVRISIVKKVGWDDVTIILAALGHPIGSGLVIAQIAWGLGRHAFYLTNHEFREFQKFSYGEWLQTFATLTFTKISICLLLLRITISRGYIRSLQALIAALVLTNVVLTVLWIVQCRPNPERAWNNEIPGTCFTKGQLERIIISQALISIISDFMLSAAPVIILRNLQIEFTSKVGLCVLMGLGVITGSLSIVRTVLNGQNVTDDPTWLVIPNWYWRTWEVFFGIAAACIPTLRPGYAWLCKKFRERKTGASKTSSAPLFQDGAKSPVTVAPSKTSAASQDDAPPQMTEANESTETEGTGWEANRDSSSNEDFKASCSMIDYLPGDVKLSRSLKRVDTEARTGMEKHVDDRI